MIAATLACILAVAMLLAGEYRRDDRLRYPAKLLASAAFVAVGGLALPAAPGAFERCVVAGLVFGAIGDLAMLPARGFLVGLVAFLLGHLAYVAGVDQAISARAWLGLAGAPALAPAAIALGALAVLWPRLGSMRGPVIAYVAVITAMVIAAIALARGRIIAPQRARRFLAGAVLFFASDLAVAREKFPRDRSIASAGGAGARETFPRDRSIASAGAAGARETFPRDRSIASAGAAGARAKFVAPGFANKAWGLPAYYAGQLLIAWSLAA